MYQDASIPRELSEEIRALLADPARAALASGEADTKPALHDQSDDARDDDVIPSCAVAVGAFSSKTGPAAEVAAFTEACQSAEPACEDPDARAPKRERALGQ